jgi:hypothetical protein
MGPGFRRGRRRGLVAGAVVGSAVARSGQNNQTAPVEVAPELASASDQMAELTQLGGLRDKGILTEEEFVAKKKEILRS